MAEHGVFLDDGVQRLGDRTDLSDGRIGGGGAAVSIASRAHASGRLASGDPLTIGHVTGLGGAARHTGQRSARPGAFQLPLGQDRVVARHFDVDVVFQRERDGILHGQVKHAGSNQVAQATGISEADRRDFARASRAAPR